MDSEIIKRLKHPLIVVKMQGRILSKIEHNLISRQIQEHIDSGLLLTDSSFEVKILNPLDFCEKCATQISKLEDGHDLDLVSTKEKEGLIFHVKTSSGKLCEEK